MHKNHDTFSPVVRPSEPAFKTASADGAANTRTPLTSADVGSEPSEKRKERDVEKRVDSGVIVDCNSVEESGEGADSYKVTTCRN